MKDKEKDNFSNIKNVPLSKNSEKNNKLVKEKDNKKIIKKASIIKSFHKEIKYKLKKIKFIGNITIISINNKKNSKLFTNKKLCRLT